MVPLEGPAAPVGRGLAQGATACIEAANRAGGVRGQPVELVTVADPRNTARSVQAMRDLIDQSRPAAVLHPLNADFNAALIDSGLLARTALGVVGAWTGSTAIRARRDPHLFFTRVGLREEVAQMLELGRSLGAFVTVVAYQNDGFGRDALAQATQQIEGSRSTLAAGVPHPRLGSDASAADVLEATRTAAAAVIAARPQALLFFGSASFYAGLLRHLRPALGQACMMFAGSVVDPAALVEAAGVDVARGVAIVQVVPPINGWVLGIAQDYLTAMRQHGGSGWRPSAFALEGFINARISIEALRRAVDPGASEAVLAALGSLRLDLGGFGVDFTQGRREGVSYTGWAVLDAMGQPRR
jgi:ABC-type branched-subunit amino acid transport system substrate-binding protein